MNAIVEAIESQLDKKNKLLGCFSRRQRQAQASVFLGEIRKSALKVVARLASGSSILHFEVYRKL